MGKPTQQSAAKQAECHLVAELLNRGATPYPSALDPAGDMLVRTAQNILLELKVLLPVERSGKVTRTFTAADDKPDRKRFIVCVEVDEGGTPTAWVFPSVVFWAYGAASPPKGLRNLNLKRKRKDILDEDLGEHLCGFRDRWELITDYKRYRRYMNSPQGYEDLEDLLAMKEALETTAAEKVTLEKYGLNTPAPV